MGVITCSGMGRLQKKKGSAAMTAMVGGLMRIFKGLTCLFSPVTAYTPSVHAIALKAML